jgi:hypothetical protein
MSEMDAEVLLAQNKLPQQHPEKFDLSSKTSGGDLIRRRWRPWHLKHPARNPETKVLAEHAKFQLSHDGIRGRYSRGKAGP